MRQANIVYMVASPYLTVLVSSCKRRAVLYLISALQACVCVEKNHLLHFFFIFRGSMRLPRE